MSRAVLMGDFAPWKLSFRVEKFPHLPIGMDFDFSRHAWNSGRNVPMSA